MTYPVTITIVTFYPKNELSYPFGNTCGILFLQLFHQRDEGGVFIWVSNDPKRISYPTYSCTTIKDAEIKGRIRSLYFNVVSTATLP